MSPRPVAQLDLVFVICWIWGVLRWDIMESKMCVFYNWGNILVLLSIPILRPSTALIYSITHNLPSSTDLQPVVVRQPTMRGKLLTWGVKTGEDVAGYGGNAWGKVVCRYVLSGLNVGSVVLQKRQLIHTQSLKLFEIWN
jgi:hypothetical protein